MRKLKKAKDSQEGGFAPALWFGEKERGQARLPDCPTLTFYLARDKRSAGLFY